MAHSLVERRPFVLLIVLLTAHLILMSGSVRRGGRGSLLEEVVLGASAPFLKIASWVARTTEGAWETYVALRGVERENRRLRGEVASLLRRAQEGEEARHEARRLQELLDLEAAAAYPTVAARVIGYGESSGAQVLILDRGAGAGVRVNQPVITPRGLVGRIVLSGPGISKAQVIRDPNSSVAALIQRSRAQGMVVGAGADGCRMEYVSGLEDIEVGDVVVTSGLDRIHPRGLVLGTVAATDVGEGLTRTVAVRPEVDFGRLEEVLVLLKPEGSPAEEGP